MAKDDAPGPAPKEPTRLDALRAELKEIAPAVKLERVEAVPDTEKEPGSKAHVKASWGLKRVAAVVDPPHTPDLDAAERAVLEVVISHHRVA